MRPNVLLVVLDSVRARNTSLHGYDRNTTPFLRSFAERATWYTQARAPAATSLTSHASIFTGRAVPEHGLTATDKKLKPGHTIFEWLRDTGYATGVFSENTWITDVDSGLNLGFDTVVGSQNLPYPEALNPRQFVADGGRGNYADYLREAVTSQYPVRSLLNGVAIKLAYDYPSLLPEALRSRTRGDVYVDELLRWIHDQSGSWTACLNLMDAHIPYEPAPEYDRWGGDRARAIQNEVEEQKWEFAGGHRPWWERRALEGLYDGAIRQTDAIVETLVDELEQRDMYDDTLIVITADHGEGFGERSHVRDGVRIAEHNVAIHEGLTHVPLLVKKPGQTASERIDDLVSLSAFPDAVRRIVDPTTVPETEDAGDRERGDEGPLFVREEAVVSTAAGLDEPKQRRAEPWVDDMTPYTATSRAVYDRTEDDSVRKYVSWRDVTRTVEIPDATTSFVTAETDDGRVEQVFGDLSDEPLTESGTKVEDLADATRRQLEELSYI